MAFVLIYFDNPIHFKIMHVAMSLTPLLLNNVFIGQPCGMTENMLCLPFINICTEERE